VTRFYLKIYRRHRVTLKNLYIYPPDVWERIYRWPRSIEPRLPAEVEINTLMYRDESISTDGPVVSVLATAYGDSEQHARDVLSVFETCPVRDRALVADIGATTFAWPRSRRAGSWLRPRIRSAKPPRGVACWPMRALPTLP
jgi:hypothetical protein